MCRGKNVFLTEFFQYVRAQSPLLVFNVPISMTSAEINDLKKKLTRRRDSNPRPSDQRPHSNFPISNRHLFNGANFYAVMLYFILGYI